MADITVHMLYHPNTASMIPASSDENPATRPSTAMNVSTAAFSQISTRIRRCSTTSGVKSAHTPSTSAMLQMFAPTTLPNARPPNPRSADTTFSASSGALVPHATSVRPTTSDGTRRRTAASTDAETSKRPPASSSTSPPTNSATLASIVPLSGAQDARRVSIGRHTTRTVLLFGKLPVIAHGRACTKGGTTCVCFVLWPPPSTLPPVPVSRSTVPFASPRATTRPSTPST
ncbi:MAG: hypothetical protein SFY69_13235 [Planctomycetota bacterium]|nr:hypothetical protein [Planctomycetota bacterium]